jgi:hypothetical protein
MKLSWYSIACGAIAILLVHSGLVEAQNDPAANALSTTELEELEKSLMQELAEKDRELRELKTTTTALRDEQEQIDTEAKQQQEEEMKEKIAKEKHEKELESVQKGIQEKQAAIGKMTIHVAQLGEHISKLERTLETLQSERLIVERRLKAPSLLDVLDTKSQNWSSVPRHVYFKAVHDVAPAISEITAVAMEYRHRVRHSSPMLEICVSFILYGFVVGSIYALSKIYSKVRGNFTIDRLLFLGDSICATFWALVVFCFLVLWRDPIEMMQSRSPVLFFMFQIAAMCGYTCYVLLRVLVLGTDMTLTALGEALAVIVVGQHYYIRIWQPAIFDEAPRGSLFYYVCYIWLFASFARCRVNQFHPLRQLRGSKLSTFTSLRIMLSRFSHSKVPDGDLETAVGRNP